jgi:hypothetical protein
MAPEDQPVRGGNILSLAHAGILHSSMSIAHAGILYSSISLAHAGILYSSMLEDISGMERTKCSGSNKGIFHPRTAIFQRRASF